jgi:hypothetical protein
MRSGASRSPKFMPKRDRKASSRLFCQKPVDGHLQHFEAAADTGACVPEVIYSVSLLPFSHNRRSSFAPARKKIAPARNKIALRMKKLSLTSEQRAR